MSRGIAALIVSSFVATLGMVPLGHAAIPDLECHADEQTRIRYLTYRSSRTLEPMDGVKLRAQCVTTFKVEDGKVASASFQGNDCR
jgi:hypothetical protein